MNAASQSPVARWFLRSSIVAVVAACTLVFTYGSSCTASVAAQNVGCPKQEAKPLKQYRHVLPNGEICRCTPVIRHSRSRVYKTCPCSEIPCRSTVDRRTAGEGSSRARIRALGERQHFDHARGRGTRSFPERIHRR